MEATFEVAALVTSLSFEDDYYEVGGRSRRIRQAVQDFHPAHWSETLARRNSDTGLGRAGPRSASIPAMLANRRLFETVITG